MTCLFGDRTPATMSMGSDVAAKLLIFLRRPKTSLNFLLCAAVMTHSFNRQLDSDNKYGKLKVWMESYKS